VRSQWRLTSIGFVLLLGDLVGNEVVSEREVIKGKLESKFIDTILWMWWHRCPGSRKAAEQGDAHAQFRLGLFFFYNGDGVD
jgi:hypothetical protein